MSTALKGFIEGVGARHKVEFVATQIDNEKGFQSWRSAIRLLLSSPKQEFEQTIAWFHMGPWLSMVRKSSLACVARLKGAHCIAHFHSPAQARYLSSFLGRMFIRIILLPFDQVVVLTPWWVAPFAKVTGARNIHVVSNPLEKYMLETARHYIASPRNSWSGGKLKLLSMARLIEGKGIELVIQSLQLLPDGIVLAIAGDGPERKRLEKLVADLGLSKRVTFEGWVDKEKKSKLLSDADIFCLPSKYDSFGMVFVEAMAYSLPVIAYGWGPIIDVVSPETGVALSSNKDKQLLANTICHIRDNYCSYLGNGPKRVIEHFSTHEVAAQFDAGLKQVNHSI